jgi:hypothetical protein
LEDPSGPDGADRAACEIGWPSGPVAFIFSRLASRPLPPPAGEGIPAGRGDHCARRLGARSLQRTVVGEWLEADAVATTEGGWPGDRKC